MKKSAMGFFIICYTVLLIVGAFSQNTHASNLQHSLPSKSLVSVNNNAQNEGMCSYRVDIRTSCSSTSFTRDHISISFGDAYGNQVYAPRIDDPRSRAFERCSTDTYQVHGPCTHQVCYVYLYRSGPDGWKPKTVTISGHYTRPVTFYYNSYVPDDMWFGFNLCSRAVASV